MAGAEIDMGAGRVRYSDRAVRRLCIALALLRGLPAGECLSEADCDEAMREISSLAPHQQDRLRRDVDWVEAYERMERACLGGTESRAGLLPGRRSRICD